MTPIFIGLHQERKQVSPTILNLSNGSSELAFSKVLGDTAVVIFNFLLTSPKTDMESEGFVSAFRTMSFAHRKPLFVAIPGHASQSPPKKPREMKKRFLIMDKFYNIGSSLLTIHQGSHHKQKSLYIIARELSRSNSQTLLFLMLLLWIGTLQRNIVLSVIGNGH